VRVEGCVRGVSVCEVGVDDMMMVGSVCVCGVCVKECVCVCAVCVGGRECV
jgi:hypothetical protein